MSYLDQQDMRYLELDAGCRAGRWRMASRELSNEMWLVQLVK